jgi:phage terminase Nu1 subunit (DNA packaging protein)
VATDLTETDFAAMIGVPVEQLAALEREGMPTIGKAKTKRYPVPSAIRWYVDYAVARRVGGIPPRVNKKDLAALVGVVDRTVTNLVDAGKVPSLIENGRRLYPLPAAVHEFIKYQKELAQGTKKDDMNELEKARLRKLNAEADQAEMTSLRLRGEFIDRVTSQRAIAEIVQSLRSQVGQAPNRYGRKFVAIPTEAKARQVLKLVLNDELVRWGAVVAAVGRRIQVVAEDLEPIESDEAVTEPVAADG